MPRATPVEVPLLGQIQFVEVHVISVADKSVCGERSSNSCGDDGRQRRHGVTADHELQSVRGARKWRPEGTRDATRRACTDEHSHIMAPALQKPAHLRAYSTRCLREATFDAERSPKPHASNDCRLTKTLSVSDIRPPCSALASIGSTIGCGRLV